MNNDIIKLSHGAGGKATQKLINDIIRKYFTNDILDRMEDGAVLEMSSKKIVMTTDSFVVSPLFFSGGNIGKLSVCGTINDISAMGARPLYITVGLILEEGLKINDLETILKSMRETADEAGVKIVAGDTKVVEKGKADGLFINTAGIGEIINEKNPVSVTGAKPGDVVIINGNIGDHEISILKDREGLDFEADIKSDCAPLNKMTEGLILNGIEVHVMRDPTRGGLASVLNEIAESSGVDIEVVEEDIPVNRIVKAACDIMGFEPPYLANEGKMVIIVPEKDSKKALTRLKKSIYGKDSVVIGRVVKANGDPKVKLNTVAGGERVLFTAEGEQLPRIC